MLDVAQSAIDNRKGRYDEEKQWADWLQEQLEAVQVRLPDQVLDALIEKHAAADETASSLTKIASLHQSRSEYAKAMHFYERAFALNERALGTEHPDTAVSLGDLAAIHMLLGDLERAKPLYNRQFTIKHNERARALH